jgi:predicted DNA-binding transcriptional regulator AlpA
MAADPLLTGPQVAARVGLAPATWRGYVSRGHAPAPDDPDDDRPPNRRQPRWRQSTIDRWQAARPGPGARTDRRRGMP